MDADPKQELERAKELAAEGNRIAAREIVVTLTERDKSNVDAWWARVQLANSDKERRFAVYQVLALEPEHTEANWVLDQLKSGKLDSLDPPPPKPEPINSKDVATGCLAGCAFVFGSAVLSVVGIFAAIISAIFGGLFGRK
jgi:hypothetical protein